MTPGDVSVRVEAIAVCAGDPEAAHGMEDALLADVLRAIVMGTAESPRNCAREALKSLSIDFPRWCA